MLNRANIATMIIGICLMSGCSSQLPQSLPDIVKLPEKLLSKDEQQAKMSEMTAKAQARQTEAAKQIEDSK
jgi:hypothetical protein